jgi:hypothetical protein
MAKRALSRLPICRLKLFCLTLAVLAAPAGSSAAASSSAAPRCEMALHDGKLTAKVVEAPLRQVLAALERLSGIQTFVSPAERETPVSIDATDLPLDEVVAAIVHRRNYALLYKGAQLTKIWVFPRDNGTSTPRLADSDGPAAPEPYSTDAGGYSAPQDAIAAAALEAPDPSIRIQALRLLAGRPADPSVTEILLAVARNDTDAQVRAIADELAAMR